MDKDTATISRLLVAILIGPLLTLAAQTPSPRHQSAVLTDVKQDTPFARVVEAALLQVDRKHPIRFSDPADALPTLRAEGIQDLLVVVPPERIDVDFVYALHLMTTVVDEDPFADLRFGIITGRDPDAALRFLAATTEARRSMPVTTGSMLEVLGPNQMDDQKTWFWGRPTMLPKVKGWRVDSVNHGQRGWPEDQLERLTGFLLLYLGGHGVPERIEQGLLHDQVERLDLTGTVVVNGACYTGVTRDYFQVAGRQVLRRQAQDSFCLSMLDTGVAAYLAATHPDHGVPAMQEVEFLLRRGASLGEVQRMTVAGLVLARGGRALELPKWGLGKAPADLGPGTVEWYGTASRVLFGDPRIQPTSVVLPEPFRLEVEAMPGEAGVFVTATLLDVSQRMSLTSAYAGDLSVGAPFNTRAVLEIPWNEAQPARVVEVLEVRSARSLFRREQVLEARVVGHGLEFDQGRCMLHVQVDVASDGLFSSPFRRVGSVVRLRVR